MRVTVRLFAVVRERAGSPQIDLELSEGASVAGAVSELVRQIPSIAAVMARVVYAINREYVRSDAILKQGDELAIIPPVSGG
jgi:molybdopterin converting factor subunit 1